jgi:hypothetical protein
VSIFGRGHELGVEELKHRIGCQISKFLVALWGPFHFDLGSGELSHISQRGAEFT